MTGYTYPVVRKDLSFAQFALSCARAFGACIMQRDNDMDELPDCNEQPSDFHAKAVREAQARLATLKVMSPDAIQAEAEAAANKSYESKREHAATNRLENVKLDAMIVQVEAWEPPTPDHVELKTFMLEQLRSSLNDERYCQDPPKPSVDATIWHAEEIDRAEHNIGYHRKELAEEIERVSGRNAWVKALYDSLGVEPTMGELQ